MTAAEQSATVDAIVIGAGFAGIYATLRLTAMGLTVRSFDAADDIGGVWTWNRYPGARTDSLHETYCFTFDRDFYNEWAYTDIHPDQSEVLRYLHHVAERFDLRKLYTLSTRVESATFNEATDRWDVRTDSGEQVSAPYLVTGLGLVSAPIIPDVPGLESFGGELYMTANWPHDEVSLAGKRVAVIGTGSSGVQVISTIVGSVADLTVFQRTANWVARTGNRPVSDEERQGIRQHPEQVWDRVRQHPAGWPWEPVKRMALDTPAEERERLFEEAWEEGGFALLYKTYADLSTDKAANDILCDFFARKIASLVDDPVLAKKLTPNHPYGAKRPPAAEGYYEAFNRSDVHLVNLTETPIVSFTDKGIRTSAGEHEFDVIILATGFDAITGAFTRIDIRGLAGERLNDHWAEAPRTYLGLMITGFPNLFMVAGPQSPFANLPPGAQGQADWIANAIAHMRSDGIVRMQPSMDAEIEWTAHLDEIAEGLMTRYGEAAGSWFTGANVPGKPRAYNVYFGGHNVHADRCDAEQAADYPNFKMSQPVSADV